MISGVFFDTLHRLCTELSRWRKTVISTAETVFITTRGCSQGLILQQSMHKIAEKFNDVSGNQPGHESGCAAVMAGLKVAISQCKRLIRCLVGSFLRNERESPLVLPHVL
jgi:hypothetical protein